MMNEGSPELNTHVFTLTIDWLAFTRPEASAHDVMKMIGGEWARGKAAFRGYPLSWILADPSAEWALGTGAPRRPREVHVDLSAGIVSSWELTKVRAILQWVVRKQGHFTRLDCALDDRQPLVPLSLVTQAAETGQCITRADRVQVDPLVLTAQRHHSRRNDLFWESSKPDTIARLRQAFGTTRQAAAPRGGVRDSLGTRI